MINPSLLNIKIVLLNKIIQTSTKKAILNFSIRQRHCCKQGEKTREILGGSEKLFIFFILGENDATPSTG